MHMYAAVIGKIDGVLNQVGVSFRKITFIGEVQLHESKEQIYLKALGIIMYVMTKKYTIAEN